MDIQVIYDRLFESAAKHVKRGKQVAPILYVQEANGTSTPMPVPVFESVEHKDFVAEVQRTMLDLQGVECVTFVSEIWMARRPQEQGFTEEEAHDLSRLPDRGEGVLFSFLTRERQALAACPIDRAHARLEKAPLVWLDEGGQFEGRFIRTRDAE